MGFTGSKQVRRKMVVGLVAVCALAVTACQPGWVNPVVGTGPAGSSGDGGVAADATMQQPGSIVYEKSTGAYYVVDNAACVIRKVAADHTISTVAGNGTCGYSGDGGPATEAEINPGTGVGTGDGGITEDSVGNLYLADTVNQVIRKVVPGGEITAVASGFSGLGQVFGVAVSGDGTLYAAAAASGVVRVSPGGATTAVTPSGTIATAVTADPSGGIYYATVGAGASVWHLDEGSSTPTVVAQIPASVFPGAAVVSLSADAAGHVYASVGDVSANVLLRIVRIDPDGALTTIAGNGSADPGTGQQQGNALSLALSPMGVAVTKNNGLLVSSGHVVYRLDHPAQVVGTPGPCDTSRFYAGVDLHGQNLSGVNFADCDLTGANLNGTNLDGANLSGATVQGLKSGSVTGTPAALPEGWVLKSGWLIGPGADLSAQDLTAGDFSNVDFTGVNLSGTIFGFIDTGVDLSGANLSGAVTTSSIGGFVNSNLTGANLTGLDLSSVMFGVSGLTTGSTTLIGANIDGTDLSDATGLQFVVSGGLIGTPAALPDGWALIDGALARTPVG